MGMTRRAVLSGGIAAGAAVAGTWFLREEKEARAEDDREEARVDTNALAPPIMRRAAWGANEALRKPVEHYDTTVEKLVVHHTGTGNDVADWGAAVREIYEFEVANGFTDISYNFLIDPTGVVYEGRWARDYADAAVPDGEDAKARAVRGGHAFAHNPRSIGFALLGDYNAVEPSAAAIDALVRLLGWKCARWDLDPLGTGRYVPTSGSASDLPTIYPHTSVTATECPGSNVVATMDELRNRTAAFLASS